MSEVTLSIVRPYQTVEEFLDNDAWTVGRTDLLLIDQDPVPMKTIVHFHVALASGHTVFQGEGWAAGHVKPLGGRPGGLRVRFRKIDAASKAMLQNALEALERAQPEDPTDSVLPPERGKSAPPKGTSVNPPQNAPPNLPPLELEEAAPEPTKEVPEPTKKAPQSRSDSSATVDRSDHSGVRYVVRTPVKAPDHREELLERLRKRATDLKERSKAVVAPDDKRAAS